MKKQSALVVTVVLCVGLGLVVVASHRMRGALHSRKAMRHIGTARTRRRSTSIAGARRMFPADAGARTRTARRSFSVTKRATRLLPKRSRERQNLRPLKLRVIATGCPMELVIVGRRSHFS